MITGHRLNTTLDPSPSFPTRRAWGCAAARPTPPPPASSPSSPGAWEPQTPASTDRPPRLCDLHRECEWLSVPGFFLHLHRARKTHGCPVSPPVGWLQGRTEQVGLSSQTPTLPRHMQAQGRAVEPWGRASVPAQHRDHRGGCTARGQSEPFAMSPRGLWARAARAAHNSSGMGTGSLK